MSRGELAELRRDKIGIVFQQPNLLPSLTAAEQLQARSNIGAVAASDVGNTDTDFVAVFVGALV